MRLTSDQNSSDYWRNHFASCPDILLDGVLLHHVVECDDANGWAIVEIWNDGKPTRDGDGIARRIARGPIQIVNRDRSADLSKTPTSTSGASNA